MLVLRRAFFVGGLLAAASLSTGAHAAQITGSQALNVTQLAITQSGAALSAVTSFAVGLSTVTGPASQTGDFGSVIALALNQATLDTTSLNNFTFGSLAFGTFQASTGMEIAQNPPNAGFRQFYFSGTFTPGTTASGYPVGVEVGPASFLISFTQVGGQAGTSISGSGTLNAPPVPPPGVPEPASLAMAALPALLGLIALRKRTAK